MVEREAGGVKKIARELRANRGDEGLIAEARATPQHEKDTDDADADNANHGELDFHEGDGGEGLFWSDGDGAFTKWFGKAGFVHFAFDDVGSSDDSVFPHLVFDHGNAYAVGNLRKTTDYNGHDSNEHDDGGDAGEEETLLLIHGSIILQKWESVGSIVILVNCFLGFKIYFRVLSKCA